MRVLYRDIAISSRPAFDSLVAFAYKDARAPECFAQTVALRVDGQRDVFAHAIPLIFAPLMPHLRRLVFYTSLHPLMHPSFFNTLSLFSAVTTLELFRFRLRCFSELRQIICAFPQLKCFKVGVGVFETNLPLAPVVHPTRIRLEQLVLGWGLTPAVIIPLVRWLAGSCACATLSHLAIWRSPFNMSLQVNVLLEAAGKALLSLHEMDLHSDDDLGLEFLWPSVHQTPHTGPSSRSEIALLADSIDTHCTFAHSPNLHTIRFELRPCALDDEPREKWHLVLEELESVLRTVRSPDLRCIKIHQTTRLTGRFSRLSTRPHLFYADLEPRTLTPLHRAMTQPVFGNLTSVEFSVDVDYSAWEFLNSEGTVAMAAQKLSDGISRLLAPWNVRGLVTVVQKRNPIYYTTHRQYLSMRHLLILPLRHSGLP
ncbi:hypothetical protein EVJ58_g8107 [Rhodofomes roseus]|nr:hypothetical protein EVJ58_g8107 [Rhodofomes roseus]